MLHTVLGHCDLDLWPQYLIKSYPQHISHIYVATISNFVWMHLNNRDSCEPSFGNCDLDLWPKLYLCYLCFVFVMLSCLFIAALRPPAGKGLTSWLSFAMFYCVFVTLPCGILGQV